MTNRPPSREVAAWLLGRRQQGRADQEDWLGGIAVQAVTTLDLFAAATRPDGKSLLSLRLRRVLRVMPDSSGETFMHGPTQTTRLLRLLGQRTASARGRVTTTPTVGWMVDPKANGRRLAVWCDLVLTPRSGADARDVPPGSAFPFAGAADLPLVSASIITEAPKPAASPWDSWPDLTSRRS